MTIDKIYSIFESTMEEEVEQGKELIHVSIVVAGVVVVLLLSIVIWHTWTTSRAGKLVLHSGYTYIGPTPTTGPTAPTTAGGKFTVPSDAPWKTVSGSIYQYSFQAPEALNLVRFPNDPYDIYAIAWNNQSPESNVLIGVDNLAKNEKFKEYVSQPKISYVENWWRQFGLTGVASITPFTNKMGMKGYKAKYTVGNNPAPTDDIFFEVPKKKELVIHLANGVLDQAVFDRIVDTLSWGSPSATLK